MVKPDRCERGRARRTAASVLAGVVAAVLTSGAAAAELQDRTREAYDKYLSEARILFLKRANGEWADDGVGRSVLRDRSLVGRPGREDGILNVPGGLVHHWVAAGFIPDVTLGQVLHVSRAYADYQRFYRPVIASTIISREGDVYRVLLRIKEGAGPVTAILDIRSTVSYYYPDARRAYAVSVSEEIRQLQDAGGANERLLPPGRDSGYLWRAATLSIFVERDGGVYVELQTLGLSRRFPPLLAWVVEPIARRLGRKSAEGALAELRAAVLSIAPAGAGSLPDEPSRPLFPSAGENAFDPEGDSR